MVTPAAVQHSAVIVGRFAEDQLVSGWYDRQRDGRTQIAYRGCGGRGELFLKRKPRAAMLNLILSGPLALYKQGLRGYLFIGRHKFELPLYVDSWVYRSFPILSESEILHVRLEHPEPAVPDQILRNGDTRPLAWYLSAIWQE